MTEHYHDPSDLRYGANLRRAAPDTFAALSAFDDQALRGSEKLIPRKYTELMALAVALTTQCVYCIDAHVSDAKKEGATEAEVAETVFIAAALRAGGAITHGMMALKRFAEAPAAPTP